jgi:hypothetical protein
MNENPGAKKKTAPAQVATSKVNAAKLQPIAKTAEPAPKEHKEKKEKKQKVIRDSFTLPQNDYDKLAELKQSCLEAGLHVKKSELVRAGLRLLCKLDSAQLQAELSSVEKIKTGRPKSA